MKKPLFFLLIFLSSCRQSDTIAYSGSYFDLKGFFEGQKSHLIQKNPLVDKTVSKNSDAESKRIKIRNWDSELAPFISSDINKPSWENSYTIDSAPDKIRYTANQPELRTRIIEINKNGSHIKSILIINQNNNTLYFSTERLEYFSDSLYRIEKKQKVAFIGTNNYTVTDRIIK